MFNHKEYRKKYDKKYYSTHKDYYRQYYIKNKEKLDLYRKNWKKNSNREEKDYSRYVVVNRNKILDILGNKCVKCNFNDKRALQIDHIYGGGNKEIRSHNNTNQMIRYYLKNIDMIKERLQLLCANCNWIKRVENKECDRK